MSIPAALATPTPRVQTPVFLGEWPIVALWPAFALLLAINLVAIAVGPWAFPWVGARATIAFEGGPWTWLSVILLLSTAVSVLVHTVGRSDRRWWIAVAAGFVYLAVDEGLVIHERFDEIAGTDAIRAWGWAIPGVIIAALLASLFARGFLRLEVGTRNRLLLAAATYACGAVAVEVVAGLWESSVGLDRTFFLITTVEEVLEVVGPMLVIRAMARLGPAPRRGLAG